MTPEEEARQEIDGMLDACGWQVQDYKRLNIMAASGVAVREFPFNTGHADYMLYADGEAVGTVEAKPTGTLTGIEGQSLKYVGGLPADVPAHHRPLPFHYESTGAVTQVTNLLDPHARSRQVFAFHRPEELVRLAEQEQQLRAGLKSLPELDTTGLWAVQVEAIRKLEESFADGRPKALIQMATGSGKTFTACSALYRLIKFAGAKRVLFLVDRCNLGRQAYREFTQYVSPYSNMQFGEEYNIQLLRKNSLMPAAKVCITTIQRVFSMLQGEGDYDEENEERSGWEDDWQPKEPVPVEYNPAVPIEAFDFVIVDECHRSIYNQWRQVLDYFDAFLIGLTATPSKQTIGFFDENLVMEYGHRQAVADGVNVDFNVYRIRTKITEKGATLEKEPKIFVPRRDKRTRKMRYAELDDDLTYTANQLDRDVVNPSQIRTVIQTFRDRLFTDIFPGRTEVPKTLVFAKDDSHADDITRLFREEFARGNDFCQKITYKTTGKTTEDLIQEFRTAFFPRIAVTVDMIATGTDVKPLECLLFMRNVKSVGYFDQMKGRGVRVISTDDLQQVTPDAKTKTHFVIVDAVGVCEQDKTETKPIDRQPTVPLAKLLGAVAKGIATEGLASALAARFVRLDRQMDVDQRARIVEVSGGPDLRQLAGNLLTSVDPDEQQAKAAAKAEELGRELTEKETEKLNRSLIADAMAPLHDPKLREAILEVKQSLEQVIDEINFDDLLAAGLDAKALGKARDLVASFRQFVEDNKDEIEGLRILYSRPHREGLRYQHVKDLAAALKHQLAGADPEQLWQAHRLAEPDKVKEKGGTHLTDLIALVRHVLTPEDLLVPFASTVEHRYREWREEQAAAGLTFTPEQEQWLDAIRDHIAANLRIDHESFKYAPLIQRGGLGKVYQLFGERLPVVLEEMNVRLAA